eukprot:5063966-Amphidinium_carterae.1
MLQDRSYVATHYLLNDEEMTDLMEYQLTQQYQQHQNYPEITNMSTTLQKPSTTTAECYSTS